MNKKVMVMMVLSALMVTVSVVGHGLAEETVIADDSYQDEYQEAYGHCGYMPYYASEMRGWQMPMFRGFHW